MSWLEKWVRTEGKQMRVDSGEGYFTCRVIQAKPNWMCLGIGLFIAVVAFFLAKLTSSEPLGFWFFLIFGILVIGLVLWAFLGSYLRRMEASCTVADGKITWHEEYPLPARFDTEGEIDIASVDSVSTVNYVDATRCGIEFSIENRTKLIAGSLGPALISIWKREFFEAVKFWNPAVFASDPSSRTIDPGGDNLARRSESS